MGHIEHAQIIIEKFNGHFKSLASKMTNINVVLERLTAAITTHYDKVTKLLGKIAINTTNAATGTSNRSIDTTGTCTL